MRRNWKWGSSGLIIKKWRVYFNVRKTPHNIQQVWVILLGLPMVFGKKIYLEAIRNKLGKFVSLEDNWEDKTNQRCACILFEMDMRDGLFEEIKTIMHENIWWQQLDY